MEVPDDKRIVVDVDGVIAKKQDKDYSELDPNNEVVEKLKEYRDKGFYIILNTARNMRTFEGRIGKINAKTAPELTEWLEKHNVPYDEIHFGKPWCGHDGFYIDDNAIRPSEFKNKSHEELLNILEMDANGQN